MSWAILPSVIAAVTASLQANQSTTTREASDGSETREIIADLRDDVRRLRRQRSEEETRARKAEDAAEVAREEVKECRDMVRYLEHKIEYLRRELVTHQRARSPFEETNKLRDTPQDQLVDIISRFESKYHRLETSTQPGSRENEPAERNHTGMDVDGAPATGNDRRTLGERLESPPKPLGKRIGPARPNAFNCDIPATAQAILNFLVPMEDEQGLKIIPTGPMHGFRLMWGLAIDMSKALPYVPPDTTKTNPMTGRTWTKRELARWPKGIPGWSSDAVTPVTMDTAPVKKVNYHRLKEMDRSLQMVKLPRITAENHGPPWRFPATPEEAEQLRVSAETPGNLLALEFWAQFVQECHDVEVYQRNALQEQVASQEFLRPLWAPFKPNEEVLGQADRSESRQRARSKQTPEFTTPPERADPGRRFGQVRDAGPLPGKKEKLPPIPKKSATKAKVLLPSPTPSKRTLRAGTNNVDDWVSYLNENKTVSVPGIERNENGHVADLSALRGMLRVAQLGCDSDDGRLTLRFITGLASFIKAHPLHILASQLMDKPAMTNPEDMTVTRISAHFKDVLSKGMDFAMDDYEQVGEASDVSKWLLVVDPGSDAVSLGEEDDMMEQGLNPNLSM